MQSPKNKFIARFRSPKAPEADEKRLKSQQQPTSHSSVRISGKGGTFEATSHGDLHSSIIHRLEQHVQYLEKKLNDAERDVGKAKDETHTLQYHLQQKDVENSILLQKMEDHQNTTRRLLAKFEDLQADYQNLQLQQKMQKITMEINEQKEVSRVELRHRQHKKGKFSAAFLPSPLDSPSKNLLHDASKYDFVKDDNIDPALIKAKNPINSHLMDEYKKIKQEKIKREKEITQLKFQNEILKREVADKQKETMKARGQRQKREQLLAIENAKLKEKVQLAAKESKLMFNKLKKNEEKMIELTTLFRDKPESVDEERFQGYSSVFEIKQMVERISRNLQIESNIIELSLQLPFKYDQSSQTEHTINPEMSENQKFARYEEIVRQLKEELDNKDIQFKEKEEEYHNRYSTELRECMEMMDLYKSRIEELSNDISLSRVNADDRNGNIDILSDIHLDEQIQKTISNQCQCQIIPADVYQERQEILDKVRIFIELNQEHIHSIRILTAENQDLKAEIEHLRSQHPPKLQIETQVDISQFFESQNPSYTDKDHLCENCIKIQFRLHQLETQNEKLDLKSIILEGERDHLNTLYRELSTNNKQLQIELQSQSERANDLACQLQQRSAQLQRSKHEIMEYQQRINNYEKEIENYELRIEVCKREIDALQS